jgi:hypothetical protein
MALRLTYSRNTTAWPLVINKNFWWYGKFFS